MNRPCTRTTCASNIWITATALLIGMLTPAVAGNTTGTCTPAKVTFIGNDTNRQSSSQSFVNLPGASIIFTQGGNTKSCVIVYFSAEVGTTAGALMYMRATIDDLAIAIPPETTLIYDSTHFQTHGASFIFHSVAPGPHTIRIQYHEFQAGGNVVVTNSNTIVHYVP